MTPPSVLISGAGVAGPTLAYWLAHHGIRATVVERAQGVRSSGNPVDVRGPALPVAEGMGLMAGLRAAATQATGMRVIDADGRQIVRVPLPASRSAAGNAEVELPRGDLAALLYQAARDRAEFLFDDTIVDLSPDAAGVDVTFDRAAPRRFDLVIGPTACTPRCGGWRSDPRATSSRTWAPTSPPCRCRVRSIIRTTC